MASQSMSKRLPLVDMDSKISENDDRMNTFLGFLCPTMLTEDHVGCAIEKRPYVVGT